MVLSINAEFHWPKGSNPHRPSFYCGIWHEGTWFDGTWHCGEKRKHPDSHWLSGTWIKGDYDIQNGWINTVCGRFEISPKCYFKPNKTLSLNYAKYQDN